MMRGNILKLNNDEMPVVAEMYSISHSTIAEFAESLFRKTPLEYCLITLGGRGAFAASKKGEEVYVPAYKVELIDTCGSGDAFTAGFLYTLLQEKGLGDACKFGNALGAMVAEQHGATQTITPAEIEILSKNVKP